MNWSWGQVIMMVVGYVVVEMRCWRSSVGVKGGRMVGCRLAMGVVDGLVVVLRC